MKIRMIASDIDGTLVGKDGLSENTKNALRLCEKNGITVVLASGRTFYGAVEVAFEAGLNGPVVSANGGRADSSKTGEAIFEDVIEPEMSMRIHDYLRSTGCFMTSYVGKRIYMLSESNGYGSTCVWKSEALKNVDYITIDRPDLMLREGTVNPYKYEAYTDDVKLMNTIRETLSSWGLSVSSAYPYNLEIMSPGGGKGRAIRAIAEKMGIARNEIMAFGDGTNDLSMIQYAGYGVAMGNAVEPLKKAAWMIAPDQKDDGVAYMISKYVLSGGDK